MKYYAFDFGTTHIRLFNESEVLFDEPSLAALNDKGSIIAIGKEARQQRGNRRVVNVTRQKNADLLCQYIDELCRRYRLFRLLTKTGILFTGGRFTEELRRHFREIGAADVLYEKQLWVAALGTQISLNNGYTCLLHIGAAATAIGVFADNQLLHDDTNSYSGLHIDQMIRTWIRRNYSLNITDEMADTIIKTIGQTMAQPQPARMYVQGFDRTTQQIRTFFMDENQFASIIDPILNEWARWIYSFIVHLPSLQEQEITVKGIVCCGGVLRYKNLTRSFQERLHIPFYTVKNPEQSVPAGLMHILQTLEN
ncbi:rod shape-determining protein [Catenisphaera adipataccumulans]|uniref:Actin-like ATPase involved in cell morphogenesis n=1 Tax=Catenisphaera adipataccumulans TaxID=700500 RepID=A0A7W8CUQ7_9FIRM|nr:rod shape-determining protein [Catenisphaera adipataccumulans]MBB5182001.1 actin-like ATPase involved in cell morphogenesis [Catenisphaera adipataccumulans]